MLNDEGLEKELRRWPRICFIFHDKNKHGLTLSDIDKSQRELPPQSDLDLEGWEKTESVSHVFEQYRRSGISPVTYVCHKMAFSVYFLPCLNKRPNKVTNPFLEILTLCTVQKKVAFPKQFSFLSFPFKS